MKNNINCLIIAGPTASGKTSIAVKIAQKTNGIIFSADSRQVYRKLNIGSGKDLSEYKTETREIPHRLIDITDVGSRFHVWNYMNEFADAWNSLENSDYFPIICGGTGLYIEAVWDQHLYAGIPINERLREDLKSLKKDDLKLRVESLPEKLRYEYASEKRWLRALEIGEFLKHHSLSFINLPKLNPIFIVLNPEKNIRNEKIDSRVDERIHSGMIEEVSGLLNSGVDADELIRLGLEYRFICEYLQGKRIKDEMIRDLKVAIHQFAKRQMTWFRKMEKNGKNIIWIDPDGSAVDKIYNLFSDLQLKRL